MPVLRILAATILGSVLLLGADPGPVAVGPAAVQAQPDSVRAEILKAKGFPPDHSPKGALWRAAVLPGWGQFYNRQYLKLPFVYAGLAGLGFLIRRSHNRYLLFRRAHLFGIGQQRAEEDEENEYQQYEDQFNQVEERVGGRLQAIRDQRDQFRRRRDLAILGTGLFYALTLLDAYVSAHLLSFDVNDTLTMNVRPTGPFPTPPPPGRRASDPGPAAQRAASGDVGMKVQVRF